MISNNRPSRAQFPASIGQFEMTRELGRGGMAVVYLANMKQKAGVQNRVALKVVHPLLLEQSAAEAEGFRRMFESEARIGGFLQHDNLVQTILYDDPEGIPCLAMQFVDGPTVHYVIQYCTDHHTPIPLAITLDIIKQVCQGLQFAHEATDEKGMPLHIIHRDIKPSNILLASSGIAKLGDFGVARAAINAKTTVGAVKGTFSYMSPEQARGEPLDQRTDVFALGLVLFEMLSLQPAYTGENANQVFAQAQMGRVVERLDQLPTIAQHRPVRDFLERVLAEPRETRVQTAADMVQGLEVILDSLDRRPSVSSFLQKSGILAAFQQEANAASNPNFGVGIESRNASDPYVGPTRRMSDSSDSAGRVPGPTVRESSQSGGSAGGYRGPTVRESSQSGGSAGGYSGPTLRNSKPSGPGGGALDLVGHPGSNPDGLLKPTPAPASSLPPREPDGAVSPTPHPSPSMSNHEAQPNLAHRFPNGARSNTPAGSPQGVHKTNSAETREDRTPGSVSDENSAGEIPLQNRTVKIAAMAFAALALGFSAVMMLWPDRAPPPENPMLPHPPQANGGTAKKRTDHNGETPQTVTDTSLAISPAPTTGTTVSLPAVQNAADPSKHPDSKGTTGKANAASTKIVRPSETSGKPSANGAAKTVVLAKSSATTSPENPMKNEADAAPGSTDFGTLDYSIHAAEREVTFEVANQIAWGQKRRSIALKPGSYTISAALSLGSATIETIAIKAGQTTKCSIVLADEEGDMVSQPQWLCSIATKK